MKKISAAVFVSFLALAVCAYAGFNPKKEACEAGCKKTFDDCKSKAGDDIIKKAACEESYNKCLEKCK